MLACDHVCQKYMKHVHPLPGVVKAVIAHVTERMGQNIKGVLNYCFRGECFLMEFFVVVVVFK